MDNGIEIEIEIEIDAEPTRVIRLPVATMHSVTPEAPPLQAYGLNPADAVTQLMERYQGLDVDTAVRYDPTDIRVDNRVH